MSKRYCRVAQTWLDEDEYNRRYARYEEMAFQRQPSQGQLCTPMVITDGQPALMSQTNGKFYDSKSEMRKEYRRAGVVEVGNEKQQRRQKTKAEREKHRQEIKASLHRAHSRMGFGAV